MRIGCILDSTCLIVVLLLVAVWLLLFVACFCCCLSDVLLSAEVELELVC